MVDFSLPKLVHSFQELVLRSALEVGFPNLKFILDRVHLKQHIFQAADAIGLTGFNRHIWTSHILSLIDRGKVKKAIKVINRYF